MQFSKRTALGTAAAIAALGFGLPAMADHGPTTKTSSGTQAADCGNNRSVSLTGPEVLWPPNHKFVDESSTATGNSSDTSVMLTITPDPQDVSGGDGGTNHDPDFMYPSGSPTATNTSGGTVTEPFQLRAERSGKGDGRTYVINWTATWNGDPSTTCSSSDSDQKPFTVTVPHDMGNHTGQAAVKQ